MNMWIFLDVVMHAEMWIARFYSHPRFICVSAPRLPTMRPVEVSNGILMIDPSQHFNLTLVYIQ